MWWRWHEGREMNLWSCAVSLSLSPSLSLCVRVCVCACMDFVAYVWAFGPLLELRNTPIDVAAAGAPDDGLRCTAVGIRLLVP